MSSLVLVLVIVVVVVVVVVAVVVAVVVIGSISKKSSSSSSRLMVGVRVDPERRIFSCVRWDGASSRVPVSVCPCGLFLPVVFPRQPPR